MSRKNRHRKNRNRVATGNNTTTATASNISPENTSPGTATSASPSGSRPELEDAGAILNFLKKGKIKPAIWRAKKLYKERNDTASEELLVTVYAARLREFREKNLTPEAIQLDAQVRERHPSFIEHFERLIDVDAIDGINWKKLVAPLAAPDCPPSITEEIHKRIHENLVDPSTLAKCDVLPKEHPLRRAAAVIAKALTGVTSGLVKDEDVALPELSRKSPLAPWKFLIRAIMYCYRGDETACRQNLRRIETSSAPARLVPAMEAMFTGERDHLSKAGRRIVQEVSMGQTALKVALKSLDANFAAENPSNVLSDIRRVVQQCKTVAPESLHILKQYISAKSAGLEIPISKIKAALGGPPHADANFWRLHALASDVNADGGSENAVFFACAYWDRFLEHAINEGQFTSKSAEASAVLLHMAELYRYVDMQELSYQIPSIANLLQRQLNKRYAGQPPELIALKPKNKDFYFLNPQELFYRAATTYPNTDTFQRWMKFETSRGNWKYQEDVARIWAKLLPHDVAPHLCLMEAAENRSTFAKALKSLEKAERLDPLNAEVKLARVRLQIGVLSQHFKKRKPHLVEKDLKILENLDQMKEAGRPAILAVAHWLHAYENKNEIMVSKWSEETKARMETELHASILFSGLGYQMTRRNEFLDLDPGVPEPGELTAAVAHASRIAKQVSLKLPLLPLWQVSLDEDIEDGGAKLNASDLIEVAEMIIENQFGNDEGHDDEWVFKITNIGIQHQGPHQARFFYLRARSVDGYSLIRQTVCLKIATTLARATRDTQTLHDATELAKKKFDNFFSYFSPDDISKDLEDHELKQAIKTEQELLSFTFSEEGGYDDEDEYGTQCNCPACQANRAASLPPKPTKKRAPKPARKRSTKSENPTPFLPGFNYQTPEEFILEMTRQVAKDFDITVDVARQLVELSSNPNVDLGSSQQAKILELIEQNPELHQKFLDRYLDVN